MSTTAVQRRDAIPLQLQGRGALAHTFEDLWRIANAFCQSGLFEDITDANQGLVKLMKGQELGLPPTSSMNAFDIIKKRLFIKPWAMAAKINSCGYGSYRVEEQSETRCTIVFSRKYPGRGWQDCPLVSYTYAEAKAHGLTERSPHWKASPAHMLYQRCMGRGAAMYFPELLAGLEPPPDDAPIPPERHADNLEALFGEAAVAVGTRMAAAAPEVAEPQDAAGVPSPDRAAPGALDAAQLTAEVEQLWTAAGLSAADMQARWAQQARRFHGPIPDTAAAAFLAEQQQWVTARQRAQERQEAAAEAREAATLELVAEEEDPAYGG